MTSRWLPAMTLVGMTLVASASARQLAVRTDDPLGLALRVDRPRLVHSSDTEVPGGTFLLQRTNPWLAFAIGFGLFEREWRRSDGVFAALQPGRADAAGVTSCAMCHNLPFRTAGSGGNVADPGAFGRNVPHLFGVGLIEMIGAQIRAEILAAHDKNHNGFLDVPAETSGARAIVEAAPGVRIDFGPLDDLNGDGFPGVNDVVQVTFVDAAGQRIVPAPGETVRLGSPGVAGYDILVSPFGASISDHQLPTLRAFAIGVMRTVMGLRIHDTTVFSAESPLRDLQRRAIWAGTSNAGALQPVFPLTPSGACDAVQTGELDALEWFLLNYPPPAVRAQTPETARGERLMAQFDCTACHVPDWALRAADPVAGYAGDRRFFTVDVADNPRTGRLEGHEHSLTDEQWERGHRMLVPRRGPFTIRRIFSDLRHHDLGERFYEYTRSNGQLFVTRRFRTPPLWGVGTSAPYGHDGRSGTLDEVIRRHGGEADDASRRYAQATPNDRASTLAFLRTLQLYQSHALPTDIDEDGRIATHYVVNGPDLGPERLSPELLFAVPPQYRGWQRDPEGQPYFSYALLNVGDAYGRLRTLDCPSIAVTR